MHKWGVGFLIVNKICFKRFVFLLFYVCIHNWSVSQWKQYELQLEKYLFLKAPLNSIPENKHDHSESFRCFYSCSWWIKTLPQSPICIEEISLYTVHITSIIIKFWFWSQKLRSTFCSTVERYMCWNVLWPASVDSLVKNHFSLSSKLYPRHCGMSLNQAPMFYFTAKWLGSF